MPEIIMDCECPSPDKLGRIKMFNDEWDAAVYIDEFQKLKDRDYEVFEWPYDTDN